jgi:hypothetical protein
MRSPSSLNRRLGAAVEAWNRRIHYYLGLYFLLFLWLFSVTGLLLNHPRWALARIPNESNPPYERPIDTPSGDTDVERAGDVMRQLGLRGEIDWPQGPQPQGRLDFNMAYPKQAAQIRVDLINRRATVQQVDRTVWSALRISHTFSGSRYNNPTTSRDWMLTSLWVFAMDACAAGLLVMVFGSYYMWYRLKPKRALGWTVLGAGFVACGLFVLGLGWRG